MANKIRNFSIVFLAILYFTTGGIVIAQEYKARGIYFDKTENTLGLKFYISLVRDGKMKKVPTTYPFTTGDKISLTVESNQDSYVYILNRTYAKDLESTRTRKIVLPEKGINKANTSKKVAKQSRNNDSTNQNDVEEAGTFKLLFPSEEAGDNNYIKSKTLQKLPASGQFVFDNNKGVERIYLVASKSKFTELEEIIARIDSDAVTNTRSLEGGSDNQRRLSKVITNLRTRSLVDYGKDEFEYAGYGVANTRAIKINKEKQVKSGDEKQEILLIIANLKHN